MLSREDEEEYDQPTEDHNAVHEEKEKERPKRRQRGVAGRSRKVRQPGQGRTRRTRANPVTFDIRDH